MTRCWHRPEGTCDPGQARFSASLINAVLGPLGLDWNRSCVPLTRVLKIPWGVLWGPWECPLTLYPRWPGAGADRKGEIFYYMFCLLKSFCIKKHFFPMGDFFPILRRGKVSTLWYSFFFSFMCLQIVSYISGILSFWANIHLSWPFLGSSVGVKLESELALVSKYISFLWCEWIMSAGTVPSDKMGQGWDSSYLISRHLLHPSSQQVWKRNGQPFVSPTSKAHNRSFGFLQMMLSFAREEWKLQSSLWVELESEKLCI
jgi:hypothetical protein